MTSELWALRGQYRILKYLNIILCLHAGRYPSCSCYTVSTFHLSWFVLVYTLFYIGHLAEKLQRKWKLASSNPGQINLKKWNRIMPLGQQNAHWQTYLDVLTFNFFLLCIIEKKQWLVLALTSELRNITNFKVKKRNCVVKKPRPQSYSVTG